MACTAVLQANHPEWKMAMKKKHMRTVGIIGVLLSLLVCSSVVEAVNDFVMLPLGELEALQDLLGAWNKSTKDLNSSLPGWVPFDPATTDYDPCYYNPWRGVFCYIEYNETATKLTGNPYGIWNASVVSLTVSGASIVGTLPSSIWTFSSIVSLTLTDNPGLSGSIPPLPASIVNGLNGGTVGIGWTLKSMDLQGNAFDGTLSDELFYYYPYIEDLVLSNNRLVGPLPANLSSNIGLRNLKVSNNSLSGNISDQITSNWNSLVTADLSDNQFTGNFPNFNSSYYLHTLNISRNHFVGNIDFPVVGPHLNESLAILDLSDNKFTGPLPDLSGNFSKLQVLNLSYNTFSASPFPPWLSSIASLQTLSLSQTSLTGNLNLSMFCNFTGLSTIELDNNSMTGSLDIDSLLKCNNSLRTVLLKHNKIGKVIFSGSSVVDLPITFELTGNPYCDTKKTDIRRCLCEHRCYDTKADSKSIIIGLAIGGSLGAITIIIAAILLWKSRKEKQYLLLAVHEKFAEYEMKPTLFAYSELERATRNFHPDTKLGEGAFGVVYKGKLVDGSEVAVKQLLTKTQQNMDDFLNEVVLLTSVKHRNLVKLKGCCLRGDRRLLVYEYLDNHDLADTLFEHKGNQLVTWPARFNICLGVAQGLHYLHSGVEPRILHRDIKANNVLLDHNLHPKIADFGLAMLFPNEESHVTMIQVAGTKGYMAPEYATRGQLSDKVDVFSFGVLTLEVVSGRRNISFDVPANKTYLIEWAWKLNDEGKLMELLDPTLSIQMDEEAMVQRVLTTALACLQTIAERRPTMAQVVGMLQGDIEIGEFVRGRVNEEINQTYRSLLGLNSTTTTLIPIHEENLIVVPIDDEIQALHLGESSSSRSFGPKAIELRTIRPR